jgi:hypothetical protein
VNHRICLLALALASSGCASSEQPTPRTQIASAPSEAPATQQEKDAAANVYLECLVRNGPRYDDLKSDASTIAVALKAACNSEYQASLETFARGRLYGATRLDFFDEMQSKGLTLATQIVLQVRAARLARVRKS